jgi:phosphatidylethanolamine-binding protein (PEBP) family uncharacterized protein
LGKERKIKAAVEVAERGLVVEPARQAQVLKVQSHTSMRATRITVRARDARKGALWWHWVCLNIIQLTLQFAINYNVTNIT